MFRPVSSIIDYATACMRTTYRVFQHGKPAEAREIVSNIESCVGDVGSWCASMSLQFSTSKTEVHWFGTATPLRKILQCDRKICVGESVIDPVSVVRDLGVSVDAEFTMQEHVSRTARACVFHIHRLQSVRRQLGCQVTAQLVSALILSRLDCCNAVLAGLPASTLALLQRVLNTAARLILELGLRDHVSAVLHELHWLPIRKRIDYKLWLLAHNVRFGRAPEYVRASHGHGGCSFKGITLLVEQRRFCGACDAASTCRSRFLRRRCACAECAADRVEINARHADF
jgi:hypothetical protein